MMTDERSRISRLLASRAAPPVPPGLEDRILDATTRRARANGFTLFVQASVAGAVFAAAALVLALAVLNQLPHRNGAPEPASGPHLEPAVTAGAALSYDAGRRAVLLFGGVEASGIVADATWTWDPAGWQQLIPGTRPPRRRDARMAYDRHLNQVVLFGGIDGAGMPLTDTWVWNGVDWSKRRSTTTPAWGGASTAMTFDPAYGQVLLVSGAAGESSLTTWSWDGFRWTRLDAAVGSPPLLGLSRIAEEGSGSEVILYVSSITAGGASATWTWARGGWQQRVTSTQPVGDISLTSNPAGGGVVAFDSNGRVWTWSGQGWRASSPGRHPPLCSCDVGDAAAHLVLHFGGGTWTWDAAGWRLR